MKVEVLPDAPALARRVADWMLELALQTSGPVAIALCGGTTPRDTYALMGSDLYRDRFPWPRMHWFWGDERFVPRDDPRSNYRMAWEAMLSRAPVPSCNIHAVPADRATPEQAASNYESELQSFYGSRQLDPARPLFDINLLGLGEDGHFASLFPGVPALEERVYWVAPVTGAQPEPRITLTLPPLQSSRHTAFLVSGMAKAPILARVMAGDPALPVSRFQPSGELCLFADKEAARDLT